GLGELPASADDFGPPPPAQLAPFFQPPDKYRDVLGDYRSPLDVSGKSMISTAEAWKKRRQQLREEWQELLGSWPPLIASPQVEVLSTQQRDTLESSKVRIFAGIDDEPVSGYLLKPHGRGPSPAVLVVYYEPESGVGLGVALRDFGLQLARRGFVTLSIG